MTELTTEDKRKRLLQVAEGEKRPKDFNDDNVYFWEHWREDEYKGGVNGKLLILNDQQFEAFQKKYGGKHLVFVLSKDCEPLYIPRDDYEALKKEGEEMEPYAIRPEDDIQTQSEPIAAIEHTITQDTGSEVVSEPTAPNEPVTIIEGRSTKRAIKINGIPIDDIDWEDSSISKMIGYRR